MYGVAVDGTHVYWTSFGNGAVGRANLDGTAVDQNFIAVGNGLPSGVAVDSAHIYWTSENTNADDPAGSAIGRANLDGSGANPALITGAINPGAVAVDVDQPARISVDVVNDDRASTGQPPASVSSDGVGMSGGGAQGVKRKPVSRRFALGNVRRNAKKGTATLAVTVPAPGRLAISVGGGRTRRVATRSVRGAGTFQLLVKAAGQAHRTLARTGRVTVRVNVTYTPVGARPSKASRNVRLTKL
jgi:hypothetical protein